MKPNQRGIRGPRIWDPARSVCSPSFFLPYLAFISPSWFSPLSLSTCHMSGAWGSLPCCGLPALAHWCFEGGKGMLPALALCRHVWQLLLSSCLQPWSGQLPASHIAGDRPGPCSASWSLCHLQIQFPRSNLSVWETWRAFCILDSSCLLLLAQVPTAQRSGSESFSSCSALEAPRGRGWPASFLAWQRPEMTRSNT